SPSPAGPVTSAWFGAGLLPPLLSRRHAGDWLPDECEGKEEADLANRHDERGEGLVVVMSGGRCIQLVGDSLAVWAGSEDGIYQLQGDTLGVAEVGCVPPRVHGRDPLLGHPGIAK